MWLYVPYPCAPASEVSISESKPVLNSLALDQFSQDCTSNGKHMRPRYWRTEWTKGCYLQRLSGLTLEPSEVQKCAELWSGATSSSGASHASRGVSLESKSEPPMSAISGHVSQLLSKLIVPDESLLKTSQDSLFEMDSAELPTTYDIWVTGWRRSCSELVMLVRATAGNAFLCWPTPVANDDNKTPDANDCARQQQRTDAGCRTLANDLAMWRTPSATDAEGGIMDIQFASDNGLNPKIKLRDQSAHWSTPQTWNLGEESMEWSLHQDQRMKRGRTLSGYPHTLRQHSQKRLNPYFAEWLMGWNPGWTIARTGSAAWVTESWTFRRRSRSYCSNLLCNVLRGGAPNDNR